MQPQQQQDYSETQFIAPDSDVGPRGMRPRFIIEAVNVEKRDGTGHPAIEVEYRELIHFQILGEPTIITRQATDEDRRLYRREYAAFSQGLPTATSGTPLGDLPGITQRTVMLAALHGIRSMEDMLDSRAIAAMGMEGRPLSVKCEAWLAQKDSAKTLDNAAKLDSVLATMDALKARLAASEARNEALTGLISGNVAGGAAIAAAGPTIVKREDAFDAAVRDAFDEDGGSGLADA